MHFKMKSLLCRAPTKIRNLQSNLTFGLMMMQMNHNRTQSSNFNYFLMNHQSISKTLMISPRLPNSKMQSLSWMLLALSPMLNLLIRLW